MLACVHAHVCLEVAQILQPPCDTVIFARILQESFSLMVSKTNSQKGSAPEQTAQSQSQAPSAASLRTAERTTAGGNAAGSPFTTAAAAGSVAPPRATGSVPTPLHHLNNTTAKLSEWEIEIANAHEEEYEYKWEDKTRSTKIFKCHLVYIHDPEQYCMGELRKSKSSPPNWCEVAAKKFEDGHKFRISAVELNIKAKPEYISTTVKQVVNLQATQMTKLLQDTKHCNPEPRVTCKECMAFKSTQAFDITALIDAVSERREVSTHKFVRDVRIIDGTTDSGVQPPADIVCPKISVFYKTSGTLGSASGDPAFIQQLVQAVGQPSPFKFHGIQAEGHKFQTARSWYKIVPAEGPRGQKLKTDHDAIMRAKDSGTMIILENKWFPNDEDLENTNGQETLCAHLHTMSKRTGIALLDDKTSVWQVNWVFPTLMPGSHLTKAGDKLWLSIMCQDVSGRTEVRMNEKIALEISGRSTKDEFMQAVAEGDAVFPSILSLKMSRRIMEVQSEDDADDKQAFVNTTVIAACAQDVSMPRTTTVKQLVPILRSLTTMSTAILPAALHMLRTTAAYPLQVQYPVPDLDPQPCNKVWVLIKATKKSKCSDEFPYTVITEDVEDVLDMPHLSVPPPDSKAAENSKYKLLSMCSKEARTSLTLTPAHGKHVFALAIITSVQDNTLCAETVETIQADEKNRLTMTMRQEMTLAVDLIKHTSLGITAPWTDTTSPLKAPSCRVLGKSPTAPELDPIEPTKAKIPRHE